MIFIAVAITLALVSSAGIYATYHFIAGRAVTSVKSELNRLSKIATKNDEKIIELFRYKDSYYSKSQFEEISNRLTKIKTDIDKEKSTLREIEGKLDSAQQTVEGKEAHQQELKSSKEEDEIKLEEILSDYQDLSSKSISLEQQLAQSMKNMEAILSEVMLTADQRAVLDDMNETLSKAGENMRNLITELEGVNNRLLMLKEQHEDLEEEYTKLVEQQLGE